MCHAITSITTYMGEGSTYLLRESLFCLKRNSPRVIGSQRCTAKKHTADNTKKIHFRDKMKHRLEEYITINSYPVTCFHNYKIQHLQNSCDGAMKAQHSDLPRWLKILAGASALAFTLPTSPSQLPRKGSLCWPDTNTFDRFQEYCSFIYAISQKGHPLFVGGKAS